MIVTGVTVIFEIRFTSFLSLTLSQRTLLSQAVELEDYNFIHILLLVKGIDVNMADDDGKIHCYELYNRKTML
jgi:hypothetical protein